MNDSPAPRAGVFPLKRPQGRGPLKACLKG